MQMVEPGKRLVVIAIEDEQLILMDALDIVTAAGFGVLDATSVERAIREVIDSAGAGNVFRGAHIALYLSRQQVSWRGHFEFARAAAAFRIQHLGNEAELPTQADIGRMVERFLSRGRKLSPMKPKESTAAFHLPADKRPS
jgi:hypothetical protein